MLVIECHLSEPHQPYQFCVLTVHRCLGQSLLDRSSTERRRGDRRQIATNVNSSLVSRNSIQIPISKYLFLLSFKTITIRKAMPPVEQFGPITKWMSDPPPRDRIVKPLVDDYWASAYSHYRGVGGRETLRIEDRVNTPAYQPNIDFLRSQNCFALNYQWPSQITLPSMTMSLSAKKDVDIQQLRMSAPSGCFIVLVGGKLTQRMDDIVRKVDYIASQLAIKLVNYFAEKTEVMPVVDLENSPAIVRDYTFKLDWSRHCQAKSKLFLLFLTLSFFLFLLL